MRLPSGAASEYFRRPNLWHTSWHRYHANQRVRTHSGRTYSVQLFMPFLHSTSSQPTDLSPIGWHLFPAGASKRWPKRASGRSSLPDDVQKPPIFPLLGQQGRGLAPLGCRSARFSLASHYAVRYPLYANPSCLLLYCGGSRCCDCVWNSCLPIPNRRLLEQYSAESRGRVRRSGDRNRAHNCYCYCLCQEEVQGDRSALLGFGRQAKNGRFHQPKSGEAKRYLRSALAS